MTDYQYKFNNFKKDQIINIKKSLIDVFSVKGKQSTKLFFRICKN
jgi:hypothetical protein